MIRVSQRKMIWFAILMSTFIYAVMVYSLSRGWPQPGPFEPSVRRPMVLGLYAAAAAMFVAALVVPRGISQPHSRFITTLAFFESCAIFGLLTTFLTQDWRLYIAPWALSLIGFVRNYPSE
jgi:hypothetical protein